VVRLGDGTDESRVRIVAGLDWMWRFVDELFDTKEGAPSLRAAWDGRITRTLAEANLELPKPRRGIVGGRIGHHSEHLGHLLSEMQFLQRAYPGATW
jgi:ring-1,2-phenylacetyl-CoA epoxidase subunit PaaC